MAGSKACILEYTKELTTVCAHYFQLDIGLRLVYKLAIRFDETQVVKKVTNVNMSFIS